MALTPDMALRRLKAHTARQVHALGSRGLRKPMAEGDIPAGQPLLVGYFAAHSGLGQVARLYRDALTQLGQPPAIFDASAEFDADHAINVPLGPEDDGQGPVIIAANPPEIPKILQLLKRSGIDVSGRYRIASSVWEQPRAPAFWGPILARFHEVWVPSHFAQTALEAVSPAPVKKVGYPVAAQLRDARAIANYRETLGLSGQFSVLAAFDVRSDMARKNPMGCVEAFLRAFEGQAGARLTLKAANLTPEARQLLDTRIGDHPQIKLLEATLSDTQIQSLICAHDCIISLARAEGFGLLGAQALALGVPAIVTGGTGTADYGDNPALFTVRFDLQAPPEDSQHYSPEYGRWTNPDIGHAAQQLARAAQLSSDVRKALSRGASAAWAQRHGPQHFWNDISGPTQARFARPQPKAAE